MGGWTFYTSDGREKSVRTVAETVADAIHDNVAGEIVAITEKTSPDGADEFLGEDSADSNNKKSYKLRNMLGLANYPCQGRLTLTTGVPVTTSDVTAATTVYFTPYMGNAVALYDGSDWIYHNFTERSLSLSGYTANKNYDIWLYNNSGTLTLASTVWTGNTTRATALVFQDGVYVKSGATGYRYLGTIRITGTTGQTEDSDTKRFVYNAYNTIQRGVVTQNTQSGGWTYNTATWRESNGGTSQTRAEFVIGLEKDMVISVGCYYFIISTSPSVNAYMAVGIDATNGTIVLCPLAVTASAASAAGGDIFQVSSVGYHYATTVEKGVAGYNNTFNAGATLTAMNATSEVGSARIGLWM